VSAPARGLKEDFKCSGAVASYLDDKATQQSNHNPHDKKDTSMKLATMALASAFALVSTVALAQTDHKSAARVHHRTAAPMVQLQPNYGNPNGNPDGPTTLSGTGNSQYGGSSPGTSGYN
jgi:hypothetical protein